MHLNEGFGSLDLAEALFGSVNTGRESEAGGEGTSDQYQYSVFSFQWGEWRETRGRKDAETRRWRDAEESGERRKEKAFFGKAESRK